MMHTMKLAATLTVIPALALLAQVAHAQGTDYTKVEIKTTKLSANFYTLEAQGPTGAKGVTGAAGATAAGGVAWAVMIRGANLERIGANCRNPPGTSSMLWPSAKRTRSAGPKNPDR